MLPWSRAQPSTSSTNSSPPTAKATHHRASSSKSSVSSPPLSATGQSRTSKSRAGVNDRLQEAEQDDCWDENSDDEQELARDLAAVGQQRHKLAGLSISSDRSGAVPDLGSSRQATTQASSPTTPAAAPSPSSWSSFNPFSIVAPSPKSTTAPAPLPGPEAVAAALASSRSRPQLAPSTSSGTEKRSGSYLASASVVQAEADKQVEEEEKAKRADSTEEQRPEEGEESAAALEAEDENDEVQQQKRASYQLEQCKLAIKPNVEELVKDPISLLSRLSSDTPPAPPPPFIPPSPLVSSHARRESIASLAPASSTQGDGDDDDEDPAAGYVQLDATNFSSGGPEVVDLSKEEDPEEVESGERVRERRRRRKFFECLGGENVDLTELRSLAWAGIPNELRPMAWQLLLGYLPAPSSRRLPTLARKRQEYADAVRLAFSRGVKGLDGPIWHQISIDVPRTNSGVRLWQGEGTQRSLERILYVWAIRHPASGYVQGINDLVTPFFQVFLSSYIDTEPELYDVSALPPSVLEALEADSFWCLSKLLDGIQDNYIFAQPGIQRQVARMKTLCERVDAPLAHHLEENGVEFIQFAFRWMNCLLMREMSVKNIVRMWDTYLAEGGDAFSEFHLYVCLAFLVKWSEQLREMDFQSIIMFLQSLPTQDWTDKNTELLLSEAFMWSRTFEAR